MGLVLGACCNLDPKPKPEAELSAQPPPAGRVPRCSQVGSDYVLGPAPRGADSIDTLLPFATELASGAVFDKGFAVGALRQESAGTAAVVVTVSRDGKDWTVVPLGLSHGDAEPPRVFAREGRLGVAMLQPAGASRSLHLGRIEGTQVHWGAEIRQGTDESMALDVALGRERGVATWDDFPKDREVSAIYVTTFDPQTFGSAAPAKVVTLLGTDAEQPRLVERDGGFWLFWVARRATKHDGEARYRAEDIAHRWLEVVPLDERGAVVGSARRVSSDSGFVLAYDVAAADGGGAVVMWRDDDTPSGSSGGQLMSATVRLGGIDGPDQLQVEHVGVGAPHVMRGWLAIADASASTRLSPMDGAGKLLDELASEELFGAGEPAANDADRMLVGRPHGTAVRLFVANCSREARDAGAGPDADDEPPKL